MKFQLRVLLLALTAALGWGMLVTPAAAQTLVLPKSSVVPAAKVTVSLGKDDNNNTTIDLKAQFMAQPESLHPPEHYFVVWVQATRPRGRQRPERKGLLHIDQDRNGEVKFISPARNFDIIVTAEDTPTPEHPSNTVVVRGGVARAH